MATDISLQERLQLLREMAGEEAGPVAVELRELEKKLEEQQFMAGFCGHFSAGKSSLINTLCGKRVMPTGPLPTSANVVLIREGISRALLTPAASGEPCVEVSLEEVADYCRDGQAYTRVELWEELELPLYGGALLDTPGVDSNDAGHALATYSALHLADVVFYVMDYNHVSSETNLSFAQSLMDYGKPLYMVVNQIDKHREEELSWTSFQDSVVQAFDIWNIKPQGIFYISLKHPQTPGNMLSELKEMIAALLSRGQELIEYGVYASAERVVQAHLERMQDEEQVERQRLEEAAGGEFDAEALESELRDLEERGEPAAWGAQAWKQDGLGRISQMADTAQLMTPPLRELASRYLESQAPGFKAKGWFGGGRTEAEKAARQEAFLLALSEQVEAGLDWHIRQELRRIGQELEVWSEAWEDRLDEAMPRPEAEWIIDPLPGGAMLSGEATLHYAAAVSAGIGARYRRAAARVLDALLAVPSPRRTADAAAQLARRAELAERLPAARALAALDAAARSRAARFAAQLGARVPLTPGLLPEVRAELAPARREADGAAAQTGAAAAASPAALALLAALAEPPEQAAAGGTAPGPAAAGPVRPPAEAHGRARQAAARLEAAAELLAPHPAFGTGVRELLRRAAELRSGNFTVALFGAFSAGKSSFANALLGEAVLPVSPHPTTAAIIRVLAPGTENRHRTASIRFKSEEAMREDLAFSFQALGLGPWQEQQWMDTVRRLKAGDIPAAGRAHFSFLQAALAGWETSAAKLGQMELVELEEFRSYAAEETRACFVAEIELYHQGPLTRQGIVLVDTPGADSIHARHTGVAFQYMKTSDAILFVTYYNHAFSRADKQLLSQLGRMKGSFALDKMFFLINAADLAASERELADVVEHVQEGLHAAGIREPGVYAVSSLRALQAEQGLSAADEGFSLFRSRFAAFLEYDLGQLAVSSANSLLGQMKERLLQWIEAAGANAEDAERMLSELQDKRHVFEQALSEYRQTNISREWHQENEELLYHVVQRLRLLALEMFAEFFHPSLLQEHHGPMKRNFAIALRGWLNQVSAELERELLATSLRLERKAQELLDHAAEAWCRKHEAALNMPLAPPEAGTQWSTPPISEGLLADALFPVEMYWPLFKNPRAFFEGGGRAALRNRLEEPLVKQLKEVVSAHEALFREHYAREIAASLESTAIYFSGLWQEWEKSIQGARATSQQLAYWQEISARLGTESQEL